jgi:hypothetical protein
MPLITKGDLMTDPAEEFSLKKTWEQLVAKLPYFYLAVLLWVIATAFYWTPKIGYLQVHTPWLSGIFHPIGESLIVAGVVVLLIDPFLKERLLREASKGIFHYLLGFDQQPEIQERLKKLVFDTKLFRRNFVIRIVLTSANDKMLLDMDVSFEVFNPTNEVQKYEHAAQFEIAEKPTMYAMTLLSELKTYNKENVPFVPKKEDLEVLEAKADDVEIEPLAKKISYKFGSKLSLTYPLEFFHAIHVGAPTIGMRVEVKAPSGFRVTASKASINVGNVWQYNRLFMPEEHVNIRWEREISN